MYGSWNPDVTGDTSLSDTGWGFDRSSAMFCVPKVVTKTIYVGEEYVE